MTTAATGGNEAQTEVEPATRAEPTHQQIAPTLRRLSAFSIGWHKASAVFIALIVVLAAWSAAANSPVDAEAGFKRALASFAIARTLAAAVSIAEGTEVSMQPFGFGVTLTPGHALKPVADALEQFAQLMLAASIAFGAEMLLLKIGASLGITALLTVFVVSWAVLVCYGRPVPWLLSKLLIVLVIVRFSMPVATAGSEFVYERWLRPDYEGATQQLQSQMQAARADSERVGGADAGLDPGRNWLDKARDLPSKFDEVRKLPERIKERAELAVRHFVWISVVFLLQTAVLPMLFIWGLWVVSRGLLSAPSRGSDG